MLQDRFLLAIDNFSANSETVVPLHDAVASPAKRLLFYINFFHSRLIFYSCYYSCYIKKLKSYPERK